MIFLQMNIKRIELLVYHFGYSSFTFLMIAIHTL